MFIIFAIVMWLIFAPSEKEEEQGQSGFNTDVPAPADNALVGDKQAAYEQDLFNRKQNERREQMQDLASMFGSGEEQAEEMPTFDEPEVKPKSGYAGSGSSRPKETIYASANAYRDMNRTLGNFYEQPKNDNAEMDELLERIATLESELESGKERSSTMDEQVALMEKSYELAAKYMGGQNGTQAAGQTTELSLIHI